MKPFERKGDWWLPEAPGRRVSGTLTYNPRNGLALKLIGSFNDRSQWTKDDTFRHLPVIHGATTDAKSFTLCKSHEVENHLSCSGSDPVIESSLAVTWAVEGWHFGCLEDIVLDRLGVNYWHLEEWANMFKVEPFQPSVEEEGRRTQNISYSVSSPVVAQLDTVKVSVKAIQQRHSNFSSCSVTITPYVVIEPNSPRTLMSLWEHEQYHVHTFLMLAMGQTIHPQLVRANSPAAVRTLSEGTLYRQDLPVYLSGQIEPDSSLSRLETLFLLKAILPDFERYLRAWFEKASVLKPVYDLFFGTLTNTSMYLVHRFLSLSQALETYHRRTHTGKYVSDEDWEETKAIMAAAVPSSLDKDFRCSIRTKLNYLHEFSLRKRLKDVLEQCGTQAGVTIKDGKAFVEDVVNTRNYLTHYDKRLEGQAKKEGTLYVLTEKMRCLLEVCFLTEIGMEKTMIQRIARGNVRFQQCMQITTE